MRLICNNFLVSMSFFFFTVTALAQNKKISFALRIPLQLDFQKEKIERVPVGASKDQKPVVLNYGIDILANKDYGKNINTFIGIGYFRNKFNFKRFYAHRLLNVGTDSTPVGTSTSNYI